MRTTIRGLVWTTAVLLVASMGCSSSKNKRGIGDTVVGSGVFAQETRQLGGFTGLALMGVGDVHVTLGGNELVRVEADDNILPHLETFVQGGMLILRTESGVNLQPTLPIEFHVTVPSLDQVSLTGVGDIDVPGLSANSLSLTLSGVGGIDAAGLDATELVATLSGVGEIRASGQVDRQTVVISGVGNYEAENLQSAHANVTISASGNATVQVSSSLTVTLTGSGSVFYFGSPSVQATVTGSGTVQQMAP